MDRSKSEKKLKIAMDSDVFSLFGRQNDNIPFTEEKGLRPIGTSNQTRPICGNQEKEALKAIFTNRINFQFIKLPSIPKNETVHLLGVVRNMEDFECPQHKVE